MRLIFTSQEESISETVDTGQVKILITYLHQKPLQGKKVTVWCVIRDCGILGPYFFEGNETVTVNAKRYTKMLNEFVRPNLLDLEN